MTVLKLCSYTQLSLFPYSEYFYILYINLAFVFMYTYRCWVINERIWTSSSLQFVLSCYVIRIPCHHAHKHSTIRIGAQYGHDGKVAFLQHHLQTFQATSPAFSSRKTSKHVVQLWYKTWFKIWLFEIIPLTINWTFYHSHYY